MPDRDRDRDHDYDYAFHTFAFACRYTDTTSANKIWYKDLT